MCQTLESLIFGLNRHIMPVEDEYEYKHAAQVRIIEFIR